MIVITGAAGFIGSCLLSKLNGEGITDILLVDDFSFEEKNKNFFTRNRIKARFSTLILTSRGKRGKHKKRLVSNCTYCNTYCTYLPEFVSNCTYCKTYSTYLPILYIL